MGELFFQGLCRIFGNFILAVVILPAVILFASHLIYIAIMTVRELKSNPEL